MICFSRLCTFIIINFYNNAYCNITLWIDYDIAADFSSFLSISEFSFHACTFHYTDLWKMVASLAYLSIWSWDIHWLWDGRYLWQILVQSCIARQLFYVCFCFGGKRVWWPSQYWLVQWHISFLFYNRCWVTIH